MTSSSSSSFDVFGMISLRRFLDLCFFVGEISSARLRFLSSLESFDDLDLLIAGEDAISRGISMWLFELSL